MTSKNKRLRTKGDLSHRYIERISKRDLVPLSSDDVELLSDQITQLVIEPPDSVRIVDATVLAAAATPHDRLVQRMAIMERHRMIRDVSFIGGIDVVGFGERVRSWLPIVLAREDVVGEVAGQRLVVELKTDRDPMVVRLLVSAVPLTNPEKEQQRRLTLLEARR